MTRIFVGGATALVVMALSCFLVMKWMLREPSKEWTTRSPEALQEFEKGLDSIAKFYWNDAELHFERAVELDPEFAVAKLHLNFISPHGSEAFDQRVTELEQVSLDGLEPQEQFLLNYWLARFTGRDQRAEAVLSSFLELHPDNFFALRARCDDSWQTHETEAAVECYQRLLEVHPNWVRAHNRLGYIAMGEGRFAEAEEHFETYKYIAPDQANPYDSLGELLTLVGRYEEAEQTLLQALEIRPSFCSAYSHLVRLYAYQVATDQARDVLQDAESVDECGYMASEGEVCSSQAFLAYLDHDLESAWNIVAGGCISKPGAGVELIAHRLALLNGNGEVSVAMEAALEQQLPELGEAYREFLEASLAHMRGTRMLIEDRPDEAVAQFQSADQQLSYWSSERATFKVFNRLHWLVALRAAGRDGEADELEQKIDRVNPRIVSELGSRIDSGLVGRE